MGFEDISNSYDVQHGYGRTLPAPPPRHEMAPQNGQPDTREVTTEGEDAFGCEIVTIDEAWESQVEGLPYE